MCTHLLLLQFRWQMHQGNNPILVADMVVFMENARNNVEVEAVMVVTVLFVLVVLINNQMPPMGGGLASMLYLEETLDLVSYRVHFYLYPMQDPNNLLEPE